MKNQGSKRWWVASLVLLALSGTSAFGAFTMSIALAAPAVSPGFPVFATMITINTNPVAAGGYGDVILAVEEGRDDVSPFAILTVLVAPTNPLQATLIGPGLPPVAAPPGFYPPAGNSVLAQFIYRSTNDPAHPGWGPFPGAAGQLDDSMSSAHAVAEALSAHRAFIAAAPPGVLPWVDIEFDNNVLNLSYMEFYKFRVIR